MKLLLDTHALIWSVSKTASLSTRVAEALMDPENQVLVSAVSVYEVEYKRPLDAELQRIPSDIEDMVRINGFDWLAISWRHAGTAARLPRHHRDPWDRLLIAQSVLEDAVLVTLDSRIAAYGVPTFW